MNCSRTRDRAHCTFFFTQVASTSPLISASFSALNPSLFVSSKIFCSSASRSDVDLVAATRALYARYLVSVPKIKSHHLKDVAKFYDGNECEREERRVSMTTYVNKCHMVEVVVVCSCPERDDIAEGPGEIYRTINQ